MSNYKLISVGDDNAKLGKSAEFGFLSAGISLAPHNVSGYNVCQFATQCADLCVAWAGKGGLDNVLSARIRRTRQLFRERDSFLEDCQHDFRKVSGVARSVGLRLHLRLNTFSDLPWRDIRHSARWTLFDVIEEIAQCVPVTVADYTKDCRRALAELRVPAAVPWSNVFSRSETNESDCLRVLRAGGKVAVPFAIKPSEQLPRYWRGYTVVDGDIHDLTFLHGRSTVIGLRAKGTARGSDSEFIVDPTEQLVNDRLYSLV